MFCFRDVLCQTFSIAVVSMNACYIEVFLESIMCVIIVDQILFSSGDPQPEKDLKTMKTPRTTPQAAPSCNQNLQNRLLGLGLWGSRRDVSPRLSQKIRISFPDFPILRFNFLSNFQFSCHIKL